MTSPLIKTEMLIEAVAFCRALRERGVALTPSKAIDAIATLSLIDTSDRQETFLSLRCVLTSRVEDLPVFEELFESFWRRLGRASEARKFVEPAESQPAKPRVRLSSQPLTRKGLAFFLENWGARRAESTEPIKLPGASDTPGATEKDFSLFEADALEEISRTARKILRRLARNPSRRWKPVRRGPRVDLRRALRQSLRSGGEIVELSFKRRKPKKTRLVVLCDVSGSMDVYSRVLLQFVYGLQNSFARVESFIFSTTIERITGHIKGKGYDQALERLAGNVRGWSGGTLIGPSLAEFNSGWPRIVDRRTIVIILSDGWDTAPPDVLSGALADLKRRAGKLIWLNPLLGNPDYQPLVRGMQAALPHIDVLAPLHNLASLKALERHLIL